MLLGCIADDFTGASDLANTLAKGGMKTVQFSGVPQGDVPDCEAGVVALKTRSIPAAEAVAQSLEALDWLKAQGCRQFLFKYCSTFDSTPEGNIGPVAEALLKALDAPLAVVCPVFPATGRTLYLGHLFVNGRLLSESGMENHPLNPMTDPDIARWLARQTDLPVGLVPYPVVAAGTEAIAAEMKRAEAEGKRLLVVDAVTDADLLAIAPSLAGHKLITGGSGIALGLPENFRKTGALRDEGTELEPIAGPAAVLSGSCSTASVAQVELYRQSHPGLAVDPEDILSGALTADQALAFAARHASDAPMIYSTATPDRVREVQARHGREKVATAVEAFFGDVAAGLIASGVKRLVVGGGETSGAVIGALALDHFQIGAEIDPGVPALATGNDVPIRLALKSGNFGAPDFFEKAVNMLGHS